MSQSEPTEPELPLAETGEFVFDEWTLRVVKNHIMGSACEADTSCTANTDPEELCNFCRYERELELPSLPDMVFADNLLELRHGGSGGSITFTALDALRCVNPKESTVQVAHAQMWREARADNAGAQKIAEPYDWTYTTNFRGKLCGGLVAEKTSERIDLERLKVKEEIKFYAEVFLFEDELDDNGCTRCVAKVRVMASGLFVVLRHYLRVDQVIVRINDTRLYIPAGASYILRESSTREASIAELRVPASIYNNPDVIWQHLPVVDEVVDKLCPVTSSGV